MLSKRSSFKNQTCLLKNSVATSNPLEVAATAPPPTPTPAPLQHSQSNILVQRTKNFSNNDYGQDIAPLPRSESSNFAQRTNYVGHQEPLSRTQSSNLTQKTNSIGHGHQAYDHDKQPLPHFQSTKVTNRANSIGHQEYGQPVSHTQSTKVTQRTNSVGYKDYGHDLQPLPQSQSTKLTQRTNSVGHHEKEHGSKLPVQKKPVPKIEFPVSSGLVALVEGEGITNANHPQHRMVQVNVPTAFSCMGCKEFGAGTRFSCQQCNFELHDFCALAPPVLKAHPVHSQHQLLFSPKPGKGGLLRSKCDVCAKSEKGYMFRCSACSFQLHPTCAMLSAKMNIPTHPHPLVILPASANSMLSGDLGDLPCSECKRKRSGQVYRCTVCDYYLHAVCAKNMVNGLQANGIRGLDKPSMLGVAAKIATHVVVGFMGGLFEGIGEGLGEALTQNIAKGRCNSTRKSLYPSN